MALELSYKGLSDQVSIISPNLVRNPFFISAPQIDAEIIPTLPSGWESNSIGSVSLYPSYTSANALDGKALLFETNGSEPGGLGARITCDDFIKMSGGDEMLGLYKDPLDFTLSIFLKGDETVSASTSGLKIDIINDDSEIIATEYFNYTDTYELKTAVITLDDSNFDSDYKIKIKITSISVSRQVYVKMLALTPGRINPTLFLPSSLTEETLNSIKNKKLTFVGPSPAVVYDGSTTQSVSVVTGITSSTGLTANTNANGLVTLTNTGVTSVTGTENQITVTPSSGLGDITLSLPQDVNVNSNVEFASVQSTNDITSDDGSFKARTGSISGQWKDLGWGRIGLMGSGTGAPDSIDAPNPQPGDFFFRY